MTPTAPGSARGDVLDPPALWHRMFAAIRNAGRPDAMAVSAVRRGDPQDARQSVSLGVCGFWEHTGVG